MTRALYDDGPACTYSNGTGEACVCGLGVGTAPAPCPLHPPRHSPYGVEATADAATLRALGLDAESLDAAWSGVLAEMRAEGANVNAIVTRAEARRVHDAAHGASRCGHAGVCAWMRDAIGECAAQGNARNVRFERREFTHPDTLRPVARVQAAIGLREPINVRACPACGGDPNEAAPVTR